MSLLYPAAFPPANSASSVSHENRRTQTMPVPAQHPVYQTQPSSAPPVPSSSRRLPLPRNDPPRPKPVSQPIISAGPLMAEIERLTAACEEHERKIRSVRTGIEHKLFAEIPELVSRFNDLDDQAENLTAQLQSTVSTLTPILDEKLAGIVKARQADVETMRSQTTPWKSILEEDEEESDTQGRIKRVSGAGLGDGDSLQRIERWAEEVEMYLLSEIVRVREQLVKKRRTRKLIHCGIALLVIIIALVTYRITMYGRRLHVPDSIRDRIRPLLRSVFD